MLVSISMRQLFSMASLEELVLERITIKDIYDEYLLDLEVEHEGEYGQKIIDKPYRLGFNKHNMAICPLHDDTDPSLGLIKDRKNKKILLCHCFGCGATANAIRFYQRLINLRKIKSELKPHEVMTYSGALKILATKVGVSEKDVVERVLDPNDIIMTREIKLIRNMRKYNIRDFENALLSLRMSDYNSSNKAIMLNRNLIQLIESMEEDKNLWK